MFDHVGIVVSELDELVKKLSRLFEGVEVNRENFGDMAVSLVQVGGITLEIIRPTSESNRYWPYMEKRRGIHHIAFKVKNKDELLRKIEDLGLRISSVIETKEYTLINLDRDLLEGIEVQFIVPKTL